MESSMKLYGNEFSPSTQYVMHVVRLAGVNLVQEHLPWEAESRRNELRPQSPTGTFPFLQTSSVNISERNAICQFLAETYKPELLGSNPVERAQVRQWVEFVNTDLARCSRAIVYPLFGWGEYNKAEADSSMKDLKEMLLNLNKHLEGKTFVVGSNVTLADSALFNSLKFFFSFVFVEDMRKKLFPNLTNYLVNFSLHESTVKTYGRFLLCKVPAKPPKVEKKEEPKKEAKKEEKPKKEKTEEGGDDDEDKPKKKKANPLDLLPPSTFVLDDFKREFLNTTEKAESMKTFWDKYDPAGYSFWYMQYQKLPSEGKIFFKTNNSASFFLQKLDPFRKYTFAVHGVYGVEGNYEIRGVWMWRGTDIPEEVKEHDNFPYMTVKKLEPSSENDRKLIEEYWLNLTPGNVVDEMPVAEVVYFK